MAKDLEEEQAQLTKEKQKQTRQAATISAEMYQEVQVYTALSSLLTIKNANVNNCDIIKANMVV